MNKAASKPTTKLHELYEAQNNTTANDELSKNIIARTQKEIVIVSGLPRSGTSMMMQMLAKGGLPAFTDGQREADENNQKGYYEHEKIKLLHRDNSVLEDINGQSVKIIAHLLFSLPLKYRYKIVFMRRPIEEVIKSQNKMLERLSKDRKANDQTLLRSFSKKIDKVRQWAEKMPNVSILEVDFNEAIDQPQETSQMVSDFLNSYDLDTAAMAAVSDKGMRRERIMEK